MYTFNTVWGVTAFLFYATVQLLMTWRKRVLFYLLFRWSSQHS